MFVPTNIVMTKVTIKLARELVVQSMRTAQIITAELSCALHPHGLTIQQFNVLRILRGCHGKAATLQFVTERMIHKMSNTTRLVDKLIEKKLVARKQCEENRRKIDLLITPQGLALLQTLDPIIDEKEMEIARGIQVADIDQLLTTYKTIQSKY